jgi:hypothetical protein
VATDRSVTDAEQLGDCRWGEIVPVGQDDDGSLSNAESDDSGKHFRPDLRLINGFGERGSLLSSFTSTRGSMKLGCFGEDGSI